MKMVGKVSAHPDGGSLVQVDATIDIAGRVMQFGRGLVESVSRQLFKQFADAVRQTLEQGEAEAMISVAETPVAEAGSPSPPSASSPAQAGPATRAAAPTPRELRITPLVWRALLDWVKRLFGTT